MSDIVKHQRRVDGPSRDDTVRALIGRGLSFPVAIDDRGSISLTSGDEVSSSIRVVVMTAPGERVMRPEFGCEIWDLVFAPINAATVGQMAHAVRKALTRWEPRIEVDEVRVRPDAKQEGVVQIEVDYRLRTTNDRRNLVFPFYVIPGGGS